MSENEAPPENTRLATLSQSSIIVRNVLLDEIAKHNLNIKEALFVAYNVVASLISGAYDESKRDAALMKAVASIALLLPHWDATFARIKERDASKQAGSGSEPRQDRGADLQPVKPDSKGSVH